MPLIEWTHRPEIVQRIHDEDAHSSTSTRKESLQDNVIEDFSIYEEEASHPTRRAMRISGSIQGNIVLSDPSLFATNAYYFSK